MTVLSKFAGDTLGVKLVVNNCYEVAHTWTPFCSHSAAYICKSSFLYSLRVYGSLYLISAILSHRGKLENINGKRLLKDALRSSVFLSTNATCFIGYLCVLWRYFGFVSVPSIGVINGTLASLTAILLEAPKRRTPLASYLLQIDTEMIWNMLKHRKLVKPLPFGSVLIFAASLSGFMERVAGQWSLINSCSFLRNYSATYSGASLLSALTSLPALASGKISFRTLVFRRLLANKSSMKLALFLAGMPALYKATGCWLARQPKSKLDKFKTPVELAPGFVAGLAMVFSKSTTVSLWTMWKLIEILYVKGIETGHLPRVPYANVIVYSIATGFMLHCCAFEPHALRKSYWKFLYELTGGGISKVNRKLLDQFGMDSSFAYPDFRPALDPQFTTANPTLLHATVITK